MARLKNTILDKTINRKALTFAADVVSNTVNTNLEQAPTDTVIDQIDAAGLESEQSAVDKLSFMMQMLTAAICSIECKLSELTYNVACHGYGLAGQFTALQGVTTVIPFNQLLYTPADGTYLNGEFTVAKTGFYDVHAHFENDLLLAPVGEEMRLMIGGSNDVVECDSFIINTDRSVLQGSRVVYCAAGQKIYSGIQHTYLGDIDLNDVASPGANGYISISYSARQTAATI